MKPNNNEIEPYEVWGEDIVIGENDLIVFDKLFKTLKNEEENVINHRGKWYMIQELKKVSKVIPE